MCQLKDCFQESKRISRKIAMRMKKPVLDNPNGRIGCIKQGLSELADARVKIPVTQN